MRVASKASGKRRAVEPEEAADQHSEATILPSLSLPRLPGVSRQGLLASGKYTIVPANRPDESRQLPALVDESDKLATLLLIPGRAHKLKPAAAPRPHALLYYRLGMALVSGVLLVAGVLALTGIRFGALAFDLAASQEGNAAALQQASYYANVSGLDFSVNDPYSALNQGGGVQLPSSAPRPPSANLKPTPPPAPPPAPSGTPGGPYSNWTPPPGYTSFAVQDFPGDPWASSFGQCTWWAHYKRSDENFTGFGDAWNWANAARASGYTVTSTPAANATIVFAPGVQGASGLGHVAHVEQVLTGGWVLISEMNFYWNGGGFARVDYRYAQAGSGVWFIH